MGGRAIYCRVVAAWSRTLETLIHVQASETADRDPGDGTHFLHFLYVTFFFTVQFRGLGDVQDLVGFCQDLVANK